MKWVIDLVIPTLKYVWRAQCVRIVILVLLMLVFLAVITGCARTERVTDYLPSVADNIGSENCQIRVSNMRFAASAAPWAEINSGVESVVVSCLNCDKCPAGMSIQPPQNGPQPTIVIPESLDEPL